MIEYVMNLPDLIIKLFMAEPLYQGLGMLAFLISFGSKLIKNDKIMLYIDSVASLTWVMHFTVISAWTGAFTNFFWAIRNFASIKYKWNIKVLVWFLFAYTLMWYLTYVDWYSVFPIVSAYIYTSSYFFLKGINMRIWYILWNISWLVYQIANHSVGWILTEVLLSLVACFTIYRMYEKKSLKINK